MGKIVKFDGNCEGNGWWRKAGLVGGDGERMRDGLGGMWIFVGCKGGGK